MSGTPAGLPGINTPSVGHLNRHRRSLRLRLQGNAFAVAQIRMNIGRQRSHSLRGRSQHAAQHVPREENATVDW